MAEKRTILVVDDDIDQQEFCQLVLEPAGYRVLLASTAAEGHELLETENPDLMVLDVMMEEADSGFQVAQEVAQEYPDLPVIMLSSIADASEQIFDTSILKVAELINKPISPTELLQKVARLLG